MDYINHFLDSGELEGVKIIENIHICIRLFADDMGVFIVANKTNFKKLQDILSIQNSCRCQNESS